MGKTTDITKNIYMVEVESVQEEGNENSLPRMNLSLSTVSTIVVAWANN